MAISSQPLANRLIKRQKHLKKWAKRHNVSCYRLYEKDLTDYPLIIDWYDGKVVIWFFDRTRNHTDDQKKAFYWDSLQAIQSALQLPPNHLYIKQRQKQQGLSSQYEKNNNIKECHIIEENGLKFEVNLSDYLDTGLFLDHRQTRSIVKKMSHGKRILNLFAYTGSFSCYAIAGGATSSVTIDLSPTYCDWAKRNFELNGINTDPNHLISTEDCLSFLTRYRGEKFDIIICDPPTFSNSKRMSKNVFSVKEDHQQLITNCLKLLSPQGALFFSTNAKKFKLNDTPFVHTHTINKLTPQTIPEDFKNRHSHQCWTFASK